MKSILGFAKELMSNLAIMSRNCNFAILGLGFPANGRQRWWCGGGQMTLDRR